MALADKEPVESTVLVFDEREYRRRCAELLDDISRDLGRIVDALSQRAGAS